MNKMLWQLQMLGEENKTYLRNQLFIEGYEGHMRQVQFLEQVQHQRPLLRRQ